MTSNKIVEGSAVTASNSWETTTNEDTNSRLQAILNKKAVFEEELLTAMKRDPAIVDAKITFGDPNGQGPRKEAEIKPNLRIDMKKLKERAGLWSLTPKQFNLLLGYIDNLQQKTDLQQKIQLQLNFEQQQKLEQQQKPELQQKLEPEVPPPKQVECGFCRNHRRPEDWYKSHAFKDAKGHVACPILRNLVCSRCGATGDNAHTVSHCPKPRK